MNVQPWTATSVIRYRTDLGGPVSAGLLAVFVQPVRVHTCRRTHKHTVFMETWSTLKAAVSSVSMSFVCLPGNTKLIYVLALCKYHRQVYVTTTCANSS